MENIMVSINCITYNQEKYISKAIESFLMQKTKFSYEIFIHDDASTDNTANIIREYEKKYPDLIKAIYQKENQYSKGTRMFNIITQQALGKYIAFCEGDDYWTNPYKLQEQVDYMESHPECTLCVHNVKMVNTKEGFIDNVMKANNGNRFFTSEEVISGGGELFGTNSMFCPTDVLKCIPEFYFRAPVGDYPIAIYLALKGKVYYIDKIMSAYRIGSELSWVKSVFSDGNKQIELYYRIIEMLKLVNKYSEYKYDNVINETILIKEFNILLLQKKYDELKKDKFKVIYRKMDFKSKSKLLLGKYFPKTKEILSNIKREYVQWKKK